MGRKFSIKFHDNFIEDAMFKKHDDKYYICHSFKDRLGDSCGPDKLGYRYSWTLGRIQEYAKHLSELTFHEIKSPIIQIY